MREHIHIEVEGFLSVYRLPFDMTQVQWQHLTPQEQIRMKVAEYQNQITTSGYTAISNFLGASTPQPGFAQYLALGNGALNGVGLGDTQLVNETQRLTSNAVVTTGNVTNITFPLPYFTTDTFFTEAGLYGGAATSTVNSGTLNTHLLFPFETGTYINYNLTYTLIRY